LFRPRGLPLVGNAHAHTTIEEWCRQYGPKSIVDAGLPDRLRPPPRALAAYDGR
jgi:hypothetical protein